MTPADKAQELEATLQSQGGGGPQTIAADLPAGAHAIIPGGLPPVDPNATQAGYADPQIVAPPAAPQQLSPEDLAALNVPGVDPHKLQAMRDAVNARGPASSNGDGPQILPPAPAQPQDVAPQYHMEVVPASSTSSSSSSGIDKNSAKRIREASDKVGEAVAAHMEAQAPQLARDAAAAQEVASLEQQRAHESAKATIDAANMRDQIAHDNAVARQKLQEQVDDYAKAGDQIDPDRVWHRMDTGKKVGFAISAALAGFGEALAGRGGNPVLDMLTQAQDRDLRAQEIGLNAKARGIQMNDSLYGRLVEAGQSKEVAFAAARDASNRVIADQIAAAQAKAQTATEQERMQVLSTAQAVKMAADRQDLETKLARTSTSGGSVTKQAVLVDQNGLPYTKPTKDDQAQVTVDNLTAIPGVVKKNNALALHAMSNRGLMKPAQDQLQGVQQMHVAAKTMIDLSNKYGITVGATDEGGGALTEFRAAKKAYMAGLRNAYGENATDKAEEAAAALVDVDLSDLRQSRMRAKVKGLMNISTKEVNGRYAILGLGFDEADWERRQNDNPIVRQVQ